jgi:hypothetical protein
MSDLEGRAKTVLTDVIIDGKQRSFTGDDLTFLAVYAFEKSVVANYQTLRILGEPISTRAQRERFRTSLVLPANVRIWISSFQGQSRHSGRSNPRYAKSTNDPPPLNDLDVFTHTYVIGHLVFQVLSSRFNSILNRGRWVELPEQDHYWDPASQQIWPIQQDTITWPTKYLGPDTIDQFVDRWFGRIPVTLITGPKLS